MNNVVGERPKFTLELGPQAFQIVFKLLEEHARYGWVDIGEGFEVVCGRLDNRLYGLFNWLRINANRQTLELDSKELSLMLDLLERHLYWGFLEKNEFGIVPSGNVAPQLRAIYVRLRELAK